MPRSFKNILGLLYFALAASVAAHAHARGFHPATSAMEKALDAALQEVQADAAWPRYLLYHAQRDKALDVRNDGYFTPALLEAWLNAEANRVYSRCGGSYAGGQQCSIPYNPLTCLQFVHRDFVYRVESSAPYSEGEKNALIAMKLAEGEQVIATYSMLKVGTLWKVDGVHCHVENESYNM